ncbi:aldehyde dehydrogenase family protein (plasmid) [Bradyrhizobium sp. CB82]|uniref:aldehyde dehydrogenase family protein n=1 Tax=Bradyrhizobium sp. CB82 TaxID=3039159 RepID=UPI0024B0892F|nr:aldehyde dehydrogenase family protein [Bradyrhizobium sp. CB82]WFU45676.1 aldehyde dehydrogenase family protein [Bradyrhizobium sp. CB82]
MNAISMLIDGEPRQAVGGANFERKNPLDSTVATRAPAATAADAVAAVHAAARAFPSWSAIGPSERRALLTKAAHRLEAKADAFAAAIAAETGGSALWSGFNVHLAAGMLFEAAAMTTQIGGEVIPSDVPGSFAIGVRQPAGVVLGMAPWNAPVILGVRAIALPLACGNTVILKGSELCPATHGLIVEAFREAGFPAGVVNYVTNAPKDAASVVEAIIAEPAVRRVNFTGSTRVGKIIAGVCAKYLKPVVLELGGNPRLIYADITGFGDKGPDADLPGFDITSYWARSGLLSLTRDAGAPPTWPVAGSGDNATAVGLYSAIVTALYRRERTGQGAHVTTSLLAEGVWSASVSIQAALCEAKFYPLHDRTHPANAAMNVYRAKDGTWFVLIITADKLEAVAKAIGRPDLLTDPRFSDPAKLMANMPALSTIFDEVFCAQHMAYWYEVFSGVHVTFGAVRGPQEVIDDPQLRANEIVVPLEGAGGKLTSTISSPIQLHGVAKVPAKRAPALGEHNEEVLQQLGFSAAEIEGLHGSGTLPKAKQYAKQ